MAEQKFRVPADGAVHTLAFSGEMVVAGHAPGGEVPLYLHAEQDAVTFAVAPDGGQPVERHFLIVTTGQPSPAGGRFVETALVPCQELRWWHLFELPAGS